MSMIRTDHTPPAAACDRRGAIVARAAEAAFRLIPAVALFSLFVAFDGGLRWLGLLGLVPLLLWRQGCPGCAARARARGPGPFFPGH